MAHIDLTPDLPSNNTVAQAPAIEDALTQIQTAINGGIDATNLTTPGVGKVYGSAAGAAAAIYPPGYQFGRTLISAAVSSTGTSPSAGATVATLPALTFDGSTEVAITLHATSFRGPAILNNGATIELMEGSTDLGKVALINDESTTANQVPLSTAPYIVTPSAGAHTYKFVLWVDGGTGWVDAGAGGATTIINAVALVVKT